MSAISKADLSTAVYAGKAFVIASGLVTVGALAISFGVKAVMGVKDVRPFIVRPLQNDVLSCVSDAGLRPTNAFGNLEAYASLD